MAWVYFIGGLVAMVLVFLFCLPLTGWVVAIPCVIYLYANTAIWVQLRWRTGKRLNPLLGMTACNLLLFAVIFTVICFLTA